MTDSDFLAIFKSKVLEVLKYSISFFEKHQLNWFIACGSAIGVVRHKGFIPWDDDVDIYMPRSDYNKLIALRDEMEQDGYHFLWWKDEGYPLGFGKIMDKNTTLWSKKRFPINFGIYVDIFPLDLTDSGMMSFGKKWVPYRIMLYTYRAKLSKVYMSDLISDLKKKKFDSWRVLLAKIPLAFTSKRRLLQRILKMESGWNKTEGDRYVSYTELGMYMYPRKWFEEYVILPFEGVDVRVSKYYHEYLTYIYGDYMTPPPIEQQKPEGPHGKYYVNFDENIPLSSIHRH